jgi:hypothetical protein
MNKLNYKALIHKKIDGEISGNEQKLLDDYLNSDEQARQEYNQLSSTVKKLDRVQLLDPPADLVNSVNRLISAKDRQSESTQKAGLWRQLTDQIKPHRRFALAFAAGIIIGLAGIMILLRFDPLSQMDISGTIGLPSAGHIQEFLIDGQQITGKLKIQQYSDHFICTFDTDYNHTYSILLNFNQFRTNLTDYEAFSEYPVQIEAVTDGYRLTAQNNIKLKFSFHDAHITGRSLTVTIFSDVTQPVQQKIIFK